MDIHVTAYSPLGSLSGDNPFRKANNRSILQDPVITGIAKKYDKVPYSSIIDARLTSTIL
jgi:diketogulonate reductase-like aldo/keto reductase